LNKLIDNVKDSYNELHRTKDEVAIQLAAATSKISELSDLNKELVLVKNDSMHKIGALEDHLIRRDETIHALQGPSPCLTRSLTHLLTNSCN